MHRREELDRIFSYCEVSNALVDPTKPSVSWFSLNNYTVNTGVPVVRLSGEDVTRTNLMTYLGVKFDRGLCFKEHVDHVITKAYRIQKY